jgi:hypothetical protein
VPFREPTSISVCSSILSSSQISCGSISSLRRSRVIRCCRGPFGTSGLVWPKRWTKGLVGAVSRVEPRQEGYVPKRVSAIPKLRTAADVFLDVEFDASAPRGPPQNLGERPSRYAQSPCCEAALFHAPR